MYLNRLLLITIFILISFSRGTSQTTKTEQPLKQYLKTISDKYEVVFTYLDQYVKDVKVAPVSVALPLSAIIDSLENQTNLDFEQLSPQYIAIKQKAALTHKVCGYIKDAENKQFLENALITLNHQKVLSDDKGFFHFDKATSGDTLHISFLGYADASIILNHFDKDSCHTFTLHPQPLILSEVMFSEYITEGIQKKKDGSLTLNIAQTGLLPGMTQTDVLHSIQALPGIQSINESVSNINVRGGTNDQNLILWDGVRMFQSGHFFGLISAFNPNATKEVTLIKNGTSTAFGEAVSSTIQITSHDEKVDQPTLGAGINMLSGDIYVRFPVTPKASISFAARKSFTDLFHSPTYQQYYNRAFRNTDLLEQNEANTITTNDSFTFHDISLGAVFTPSQRDKIKFSFLKIGNKLSYAEKWSNTTNAEEKASGLSQRSLAGTINFQRLWNKKWSTEVLASWSTYQMDAINQDLQNSRFLKQVNEVNEKSLKMQGRYLFNNQLDFLIGYQITETGIRSLDELDKPPYSRELKKVNYTHALFAEGVYTSQNEQTQIRAGLRGNYYPFLNQLKPEPRLVFTHQLPSHLSIELMAETKSQSVLQVIDFQSDFLGIEQRRWLLADGEDIPLLQSKQLSGGVNYEHNNWLISIEGYTKRVQGILTKSQGFRNQFEFINEKGNYQVRGIDFLLRKSIDAIHLWSSYSLSKNEYTFENLSPSSFSSNLDIRHAISLGGNYKLKQLELSSGIHWRTGKPYTKATGVSGDEITYMEPNGNTLKNYLRIDISARYSFKIGQKLNAQAGASIWNILNRNNTFDQYYLLTTDQNLHEISQSALGFTPNLSFRINF
ncbi:TonB-dependent receptor [Limibacter armeniacum]|uniref:TonB-dependent receptor n=1 Tax=Limibacter armeniacum TaxID=466084 RepID=UPI002FE5DCD7